MINLIPEQMKLSKIIYNNNLYKLNKKITLKISVVNDQVQIEFDKLDIIILERTLKLALLSFYEEFDVIYNNYVNVPDESLTLGGIKLKQRLLGYCSGRTKVK